MPLSFDVFLLASYIGTAAFSLSGFLMGVRKELDVMGVFILSFLTANGGGMIRDVFLQKAPWALTDFTAFIIVSCTFLLGLLFHHLRYTSFERQSLFILSDSIGLVAFSVAGALAGIEAGLNIFGVCVLSFITATGGGILRDVLSNEIPAVFKSDFYGSVAIVAALSLYGLHVFEYDSDLYILMLFGALLLLRLLAYKMKWHLPRLRL